jgi:hypothetical protein
MRQSGESTSSHQYGLKVSFHEAMASLINAIAPSRSTPQQANGDAAAKSEPPANGDPGSAALPAEPPVPQRAARYELADALADVANAIAPKPVVAKPATPNPVVAAQPVSGKLAAARPGTPPRIAEPLKAPPPSVVEERNDWLPISTAPLDRNVQIGVTSRNGILAVFFPCRRTEGGWINAIVRAPLLHDPVCWREWQDDYWAS